MLFCTWDVPSAVPLHVDGIGSNLPFPRELLSSLWERWNRCPERSREESNDDK
jgi:hypothetical protein